jgi:Regulator of chromosome condensation (RCC1) repeat
MWGWGSNANGIAGKDPTQITQLNNPSLIPLPSGVIPQKVTSEYSQNGSFILYALTQSSPTRGWTFNSGNFSQLTNSGAGYPIVQYISGNGYFTVDSLGDVYSNINGNCGDPSATYPYRISSIGQFGPAYSYDNLVTSSVFMQEGSQVQTVVGNSVNQIAGHTFSLQFSGVHTRCYTSPSQLTVSWDLVGNGNYTSPAVLTTSTTGYQVYQTSLSYPSAGRFKVGLQVTTPAGNIYTSVVTIGVDGTTSSTFSLTDTRTVVVSSSASHNLALGSDGKIYAWGNNSCEQLGIARNSYTSLDIPTQVQLSDSSTISTITAGYTTSYAIDSAGRRDSNPNYRARIYPSIGCRRSDFKLLWV